MAHILVIEDYSDTRDLTEIILVDAGYTVTCADDGVAGLHCALHEHPDLILMDLNLPRMDGWQATRCLKGNPTTRDIPVLAFTAYATDDACARAVQVGCRAVITKPFDIDGFLSQISAALAAHDEHTDCRTVGNAEPFASGRHDTKPTAVPARAPQAARRPPIARRWNRRPRSGRRP